MPSSSVTLGGFRFQGHEVPEHIPFGGRHRLVKHVLVGGRRVTDAMGFEPTDPKWEGRFRGPEAVSRARSVEAICRRGGEVPLSWGGLFYTVVVEEFEADYRRSTDVPYRIVCYVTDDGSGGDGGGASLDALVGGDLGSALGFVGGIGGTLASGFSDLSGALAGITSLATVPLAAVAPLQDMAAFVIGAADGAIAAVDDRLATITEPDPARLAGAGFAAALLDTRAALDEQDALLRARGLSGRIAANLSTMPG